MRHFSPEQQTLMTALGDNDFISLMPNEWYLCDRANDFISLMPNEWYLCDRAVGWMLVQPSDLAQLRVTELLPSRLSLHFPSHYFEADLPEVKWRLVPFVTLHCISNNWHQTEIIKWLYLVLFQSYIVVDRENQKKGSCLVSFERAAASHLFVIC